PSSTSCGSARAKPAKPPSDPTGKGVPDGQERSGLDHDLDPAGLADVHAGTGAVLRRPGTQAPRVIRHDPDAGRLRTGRGAVVLLRLFPRLHRGFWRPGRMVPSRPGWPVPGWCRGTATLAGHDPRAAVRPLPGNI